MLKAEKSLEAQSRLENIDEFLSVTKNFEQQSEDKSLVAFDRFGAHRRYRSA